MNGNFLFPSIQRLCLLCEKQLETNQTLANIAGDLLQNIRKIFPDLIDSEMECIDRDRFQSEEEEYSDEDCPIVVPFEEVEASIDRSSNEKSRFSGLGDDKKSIYSSKYPFLFASIMEDEDILMTCARILDEKSDVTTVREAALYLEEVEAGSFGKTHGQTGKYEII